MLDLREYRGRDGHSPFRRWFDRLNAEAARKVTTALYRLGQGNFSRRKVLEPVFANIELILAPATACTSELTASGSWFFLRAGQNNASRATSGWPSTDGQTTNSEITGSKKGNENGFDTRFQRNRASAGGARSRLSKRPSERRNGKPAVGRYRGRQGTAARLYKRDRSDFRSWPRRPIFT